MLRASVSVSPVSFFLLFALFPASLLTKKGKQSDRTHVCGNFHDYACKNVPLWLDFKQMQRAKFGLVYQWGCQRGFCGCLLRGDKNLTWERLKKLLALCLWHRNNPTLVQTCLDAIHPVFNLYRSEGEDRHYVPCNSACLSMMPQFLRTWSLVLGNSYRLNIWTRLKTYLSDLETRTCERKRLGQKQWCLVSSGVNLSSLFRWWRTLGSTAKSTYATSLLPAYLTTLKPATLFHYRANR